MEQEAAREHHRIGYIHPSQTQSDFISLLAHELRTPLHTLNGFLSLVLEEHVGKLNERQQEFLGYAHAGAAQLTTLVDDMLLLSSVERGRALHCAALALSDVITQALHQAQPAARQTQVTLHYQAPEDFPALWADAAYLQHALSKLIENALALTPPGGAISIAARQRGQMAEISVADTGCGIPLEDQPRIFACFYHSAHPLPAKRGNFGLGLPIAKAIIEQHGGDIWLHSEPGHGATFIFTIPLFDPHEHVVSMPADHAPSTDPAQ